MDVTKKFLDDLPPNVREVAFKANIVTAAEVFCNPKAAELFEECPAEDVIILKEAAAKILAPPMVSVSELLKPPYSHQWSRISFGCHPLDKCSNGGILTRGITEICGISGVGKSQILLQLALTVQLPLNCGGLDKGVAFICTEDAFPSKRLFQLAQSFEKRFPEQAINYLGNIFIEHAYESEDLLACVKERLPKLMESHGIGLIVIDSVAAIFRLYSDFKQRAVDMRKLVHGLLHLANKYACGVVCVNQVTTVSETQQDVPCLGLLWSHMGRTRIKLSKVPKQLTINKRLLTVRKFEIMFSPDTPNDSAEFIITEHGVVPVP